FETTIDRNNNHVQEFIRYIARIIKKRKLLPFHRNAVAGIIDNCIRASGNSFKIALQRSSIVEMLEEASYWATVRSQSIVMQEDVDKSESSRMYRIDKVRKEYYQDILSEDILIDLKNEVVGQINAITVIHLPNFAFGLPTRITASTRAGKQAMVDIQREVNLGGSNHSKGVLILSGYLKGRYINTLPFFLSASLVLEQTYGVVDGDSASLAELCALISSITQVPIKQCYAVTGSINQHGVVQAIGNVNEKVEGFFDICKLNGLTGNQGVIIPQQNVVDLMLREDV
ncbi:MAG TPA: AAA family ATPase, partial [Candidatus Berkiella sp.]|nr:AAA family ATPase [Candidatus Berkiella sp.]